jgi:hypothetical protein
VDMTSIHQIKRSIAEIVFDDSLRDICLTLVDAIVDHKSIENPHWTYYHFSRWANTTLENRDLIDSVNLLASNQNFKILQLHFLLVDPNNPDDNGQPVGNEEVCDAWDTGYLVHPVTSMQINNVDDSLVPYFVPTKELLQASDA